MGRRRRLLAGLGLGLAGAGFLLVAFPYARSLGWLHLRVAPPASYLIPIPEIRRADIEPNYWAPRLHGPHEGVDILAPAGTPVLASADGIVVGNRPTKIGGTVLWILGSGRRLYYYAHMRELAPWMYRGRRVDAGEMIGTVGNTGNAIATPPHLHFSIYRVTSDFYPLRYEVVDPYALLVAQGRSARMPARRAQASTLPEAPAERSIDLVALDALEQAPTRIARDARLAAERLGTVLEGLDPFLGVDADRDSLALHRISGLGPRLRELAEQLVAAGRDRPASPLRDLLPGAREVGARIYLVGRQLEGLLVEQDRCGLRDLSPFLSALETLALGLAEPGMPTDAPARRADYFVFEGHPPNVVPPEGGWLTVVGAGLWDRGDPEVALVANDRKQVLATFTARRSAGGDAIAIPMTPDLVGEHRGECLLLRVGTRAPSGPLWWRDEPGPVALHLPICIPQVARSRFQIVGSLSYRTRLRTHTLPPRHLSFVNPSCERAKQVSASVEFELNPGGRLIDMGRSRIFERHESSIACRIAGSRITCEGRLEPATCAPPGASASPRERRQDTVWRHRFSPTERYPDDERHHGTAVSRAVDVAFPHSEACVEIPREEGMSEAEMWFDLMVVNGHQQQTIFSSARRSVETRETGRYEVDGTRLEVDFDPLFEAARASLCVTIHSPACAN